MESGVRVRDQNIFVLSIDTLVKCNINFNGPLFNSSKLDDLLTTSPESSQTRWAEDPESQTAWDLGQ